MKFISRIELENFQSHKHTALDLDPNLNVIVGPSDSGKSAIIRGIKWVLYNEPSGDYFIREGESEVQVCLAFSDGSKVTRYRSKSKNSYIINYPDGEELVLNGFGTGVPDEVVECTGVQKVSFDQESSKIINIAEQLEGPFLLSEKNSTKAAVIGGLAGVDIVDDSIVDVLRELRGLNINKKRIEDNIEDLDEKLASFENLDLLKDRFDGLSKLYEKIEGKSARLERLKALAEKSSYLHDEKLVLEKLLEQVKNLDRVNTNYLQLQIDIASLKGYVKIDRELKSLDSERKGLKKFIEKYSSIDQIPEKSERISILNKKYKKLILLKDRMDLNSKESKETDLILKSLSGVEEARRCFEVLSEREEIYSSYQKYLESYKDTARRQDIGRNYVKHFENMGRVEDLYKEIDKLVGRHNQLMERKVRWELLEKNSKKVEDDLSLINRELKEKAEAYKNILVDIKVCPTCFNTIDEDVIANIIGELNK